MPKLDSYTPYHLTLIDSLQIQTLNASFSLREISCNLRKERPPFNHISKTRAVVFKVNLRELWPSHTSFLPVAVYPLSSASLNINSKRWHTRPFHNWFCHSSYACFFLWISRKWYTKRREGQRTSCCCRTFCYLGLKHTDAFKAQHRKEMMWTQRGSTVSEGLAKFHGSGQKGW